MLEQYVALPRSFSLPRLKLNHSPCDLPETEEELEIVMSKYYYDNPFEFDISEYEK